MISEPAESDADEAEFAAAFVFAVTFVAVTSPFRIETVAMAAEELDVAEGPEVANALDVTEPARRIEPSTG